MEENQKRMRDGVIYTISFGLFLSLLILYWNEPIYSRIREITESNILPYVMFLVITVIIVCAMELIFHKTRFVWLTEHTNSLLGKFLAWILVLGNGWLLIASYQKEVELFDAPIQGLQAYHNEDRIAMLFMLAVFFGILFLLIRFHVSSVTQVVEKKNRYTIIFLYVFASMIGLIYCYCINNPNVFGETGHGNLHHTNAYFNSVYSAMMGEPRTELNRSIYGFYNLFIAPLVKVLGGSYRAFFYVICGLCFVAYMSCVYVIINTVKNHMLKIVGIVALIVVQCSMQWSIYLQISPHRILFAGIILAWITYGIKHGVDDRIWHKAVGCVLCICAVMWNMEMGIIYTGCYILYQMVIAFMKYDFRNKKLYLLLLGWCCGYMLIFLSAWIVVGIINMMMGGGFLSIKDYIFPVLNSDYMEYLALDWQKGIVAWIFIAAMAIAYIVNGLSRTAFYKRGQVVSKKSAFMLVTAVLGLGQMLYYINRQAYGNLTIVYMTAIIMVSVLADCCYSVYKKENHAFLKSLTCGISAIAITTLVSLVAGGIYNLDNQMKYRESYEYKDTSNLSLLVDDVQKSCEKNTRSMGYITPFLYSELGWDAYYYLIDFADLGVLPESRVFIAEELNERLNEPILIDQYALNDVDYDLTKFYSRFEVKKTFQIGAFELYYYVPIHLE